MKTIFTIITSVLLFSITIQAQDRILDLPVNTEFTATESLRKKIQNDQRYIVICHLFASGWDKRLFLDIQRNYEEYFCQRDIKILVVDFFPTRSENKIEEEFALQGYPYALFKLDSTVNFNDYFDDEVGFPTSYFVDYNKEVELKITGSQSENLISNIDQEIINDHIGFNENVFSVSENRPSNYSFNINFESLVSYDYHMIVKSDHGSILVDYPSSISPGENEMDIKINGVNEVFCNTSTCGNRRLIAYAYDNLSEQILDSKIFFLDFACKTITSTAETTAAIDSYVYPNPTSSSINWKSEVDEEYAIWSITGELISSGIKNYNAIDISPLLPGIYFLATPHSRSKFIKL